MPASPNIIEIANRFADALDREDYEAVRVMLAADCSYEGPTGSVTGPGAIVSSYRANGEAARRLFDGVEYGSQASRRADDTAGIDFFDRLSKDDQTHVYRCRQRIQIQSDGLIMSIRHEELQGERERLLEFCATCGVTL